MLAMKIVEEGRMKDRISITGLTEQEYIILVRALTSAASDLNRKGYDYDHFYSEDRATVVSFFNSFLKEDGKLRKTS